MDPREVGAHRGQNAPSPQGWSKLIDGHGGNVNDSAVDARVAILEGRADVLRSYASEELPGAWHGASRVAAAGYAAWMEGDSEGAQRKAAALKKVDLPGFRIDALLLRSLSELDRDAKTALKFARMASMQARTESFTHWEFLAALVLIRARRYNQQPVAAAVVAQSLRKWAPPVYEAWLDWEYALCTCVNDDDFWKAAIEAATERWGAHRPFREDVQALRALVGEKESPFCRGAMLTAPRGLGGTFGTRGALVHGAVGKARRRLPFVAIPTPDHDLRELTSPRQLGLVASLALRGASKLAGAFTDVYQLDYNPGRHAQTFRILLHRTRKMLPRGVTLERRGEEIALVAEGNLALFDPRTVPFEEGSILTLFQESSRLTAAQVAEARSLPRRTAQDALRRLVEQGLLRLEGHAYVCEDTAFSEPTRARRRPGTN